MLKTMGRAGAALLSLLAAAGPALSQGAPARDPKDAAGQAEALRLTDAWLDSVQAYQHIPAISAAVVADEQLIWAKGYGTLDATHKVPATPETIYSICSISKLFTSVALMQLYEGGQVRLDEPVTTYLPWAKLKPLAGDSGPIALRGLLSHSSGLPRESSFPYWSGPSFTFPTRVQVRAAIAQQAPYYPASRYFQYSNLGLTLVGETVEAVSGQPYATYVQGHVLGPLKLADTRTFMPMTLYGTRLAVGYGALKRDGSRDLLPPFETRGLTPAAGYTSTVKDLASFAAWQFRLLRTETPEVLKASTLREMQRVQFVDPDWEVSRGLGFSVKHKDDHTYVGHGGACPGYKSALTMEPATGRAVILMDNAAEDPGDWALAVFALLDKRKAYEFKAPAPAAGVDLEAYAGRYAEQPWDSESVIVPWAGGLAYLTLPATDPAEGVAILKPKGGDLFRRVRKDGSEAEAFQFVRDASGKVVRFVHDSNPSERLPADGVGRKVADPAAGRPAS
ncbi:serine hydrolase domain-containing protein [Phenylobacterium sp.]|uniref:serine hydrolase domain-containing protein n=1 Tax=Phenylobacterium sp. TaxID=1871053 RepID=UPI002DE3E262|nr:serine hydrolase domain-containing protein [Phenylobacterium sp.]